MPDRRPNLQRPGPDGLEQGLDRLVSAGRQLVGGVSGTRPGSRSSQRSARPASRSAAPRLGELGRWVEDKLDWILEDEDDWREPWQDPRPRRSAPSRLQPRAEGQIESRPEPRDQPLRQARPPADPAPEPPAAARRRPLQAISRRAARPRSFEPPPAGAPQSTGAPPQSEDWPDDTSFSRPRWQRPLSDPARAPDLSADAARSAAAAARQSEACRPLPRSSRRRSG
ncbi:MAG: hypothetical protein AAFX65_04710 [Cyanobacteria bacterium J06638_7]